MAMLSYLLKAGGGPVESPGADANQEFLSTLDGLFPELKVYRTGRIQTSPGVEEIEGSPTEYYRTVGAIIALFAAYLTAHDDEAGLALATAGERGPMSVDKVPGKFINLGNKPEEYKKFCDDFASSMTSEEDWWAMLVFLVVHDIGKSDDFRNRVNATMPAAARTDDHDRVLAAALRSPNICEALLPSVWALAPERQQRIAEGFATNFQLPQLGQGEVSPAGVRGLFELDKSRITDGCLRMYLYHSIFDIAGAGANEKFIWPLAIQPVYVGFSSSMEDLLDKLVGGSERATEKDLYFDFLYTNFKKAYPDFERETFAPLCESRVFRDETGLALLRVLALTRNTYKNPAVALANLLNSFQFLINEMAGNAQGPQIMLYYGPDMLRMGLGTDLEDETGENIRAALSALEDLYRLVRDKLPDNGNYQFELNVQPVVSSIKQAGKDWRGGVQLLEICNCADISTNDYLTEGIVRLNR